MTAIDADLAPLTHPIARGLHGKRSFGEEVADGITSEIGSWRFLIVQTIAVVLWVSINAAGLVFRWDPYPFVLLNLLFSVQAAYTGPILLLSQNRSAERDRIMAEHDYATNEKSEQLIESLLSELLRNSQATLAIAAFHGIEIKAIRDHDEDLKAKVDAVQRELAEVEDVLAKQEDKLDAVQGEQADRV